MSDPAAEGRKPRTISTGWAKSTIYASSCRQASQCQPLSPSSCKLLHLHARRHISALDGCQFWCETLVRDLVKALL